MQLPKIFTYVVLAFLILLSTGCSQKTFRLHSEIGKTLVKINGDSYEIGKSKRLIQTNYPLLDTVIFEDEAGNMNVPILHSFKPDSSYMIVSLLGYHKVSSSINLSDSLLSDTSENYESQLLKLVRKTNSVSIQTSEWSEDSVFVLIMNQECISNSYHIDTNFTEINLPLACSHWTSESSVVFFKMNTNSENLKQSESNRQPNLGNIQVITVSTLSIVDSQPIFITFNIKDKKANISAKK